MRFRLEDLAMRREAPNVFGQSVFLRRSEQFFSTPLAISFCASARAIGRLASHKDFVGLGLTRPKP